MMDFADFPLITILQTLACLAAGYGAGLLHFRTLETVAERFIRGQLSAVALQLLRLAVLALFLWLVARLGALALIAATAGIVLARSRVLARAEPAP